MNSEIPKKRRSVILISSLLIIGGLVFIYFHQPKENDFLPPCLFYKFTGHYCPGCGITRATHELLHLHFYKAFDYNPLAVLALPFILWDLLVLVHNSLYPKRWRSFMGERVPAWILIVIVISYWIARNLPFEPFRFLAP